MLTLSELSRNMPVSPTRKFVPLSDAAEKRGIKVYHLNIGQPDTDSPKEALNAIKNKQFTSVRYSNSAGIESYRKNLVGYYKSVGIDISYDQVIITQGGSEALQFAINAVCNPGDEVIVMEPFYTNYNTFAYQSKIKLVPIPTTIETGFAIPPMEAFEKCIGPRTKAILFNNPNNPTGTVYERKRIEQLGEIVKKHQLFLISDEVYREFCYTDEPHFSCMNLKGVEDNVILVDSVSKRYSLCGARIGCFISRNKELMKTVMRFAQARLCANTFGQVAGEGALATPPEYFAAFRKGYIERRNLMVSLLNKIEGVYSPMPMGAFYTVAKLPVDNAEKFVCWMLENFNYQGETVMVIPAAGFYATPGSGIDQVRIAYVLDVEGIKRAMLCLEKGLQAYPGRTI